MNQTRRWPMTLGLAGLLSLVAGFSTEAARAQGPLASLPSKPGTHIDRIKALQDDSWLELGPPRADPKWGRARGRSWTSEMPLAPELRGAFLQGEGQHGYTKPDGHYMDDLWFYDINAHRWICCYPGAPAKDLRLKLNADGFEATPAGDLIPVAQQVHGYDPSTNAWGEETPGVPQKLGHNRQAKNGFYDPELNAVFLHSAGDSQDDGTIWVYRYRRGR